jgi:hypothetical protein
MVAGKVYDPNIAVTKLECTGYVQKVTGARLRDGTPQHGVLPKW